MGSLILTASDGLTSGAVRGEVDWESPSKAILGNDETPASAPVLGGMESYLLYPLFEAASLPGDATISTIAVKVRARKVGIGSLVFSFLTLINNDEPLGSDQWPSSPADGVAEVGSSFADYTVTLSPAAWGIADVQNEIVDRIADASFSAGACFTGAGAATVEVSDFDVTINYTQPEPPPSGPTQEEKNAAMRFWSGKKVSFAAACDAAGIQSGDRDSVLAEWVSAGWATGDGFLTAAGQHHAARV